MPKVLRQRLAAARNFNQGFATIEYTSSALVDMALYSADAGSIGDVEGSERETLAGIEMPKEIVMRHRLPHFMHIMSGYAAGYYSYLWSAGNRRDPHAAYVAFRGRPPKIDGLLKKRGLAA